MQIKIILELADNVKARLELNDFDSEAGILYEGIKSSLEESDIGEFLEFEIQEVTHPLASPSILWIPKETAIVKNSNAVVHCTAIDESSKSGKGLNDDQSTAIDVLSRWIDYPSNTPAILTGGGGTGKTFTVSSFVEKCKLNPVFLAPTHEAKKNLKKSLDSLYPVYTIAQFLGKQPIIDDNGKEQFIGTGVAQSSFLAIIDEASMIGTSDYLDILDACNRCLFIGDEAQLPPVGEKLSPVFGNYKNSTAKVELTEVMRSSGYLSEQVTLSRKASLEGRRYIVKPGGEQIHLVSRNSALALARNLFESNEWTEDPNFCRFLAFRNKIVDSYNSHFQTHPDPYYEGNKIKCLAPVSRLNWDRVKQKYKWVIVANNSDNVLVLNDPWEEPMEDVIAEGIDYSGCDDLASLLGGKFLMFEAQNEDGFSYYATVLPVSVEKRRDSLIKNILERLKKKQDHSATKALKKALSFLYKLGDEYSDLYCSTVHKSQGSTINHVFVDVSDLQKPPYKMKPENDMRPSLLYTAFSRASTKLYLIND